MVNERAPGKSGPHQHAKEEPVKHRSAGGVVFKRDKGGVYFLVLLQWRKSGALEWVMPKGHIEGEETEEQAALREVHEEAGILDVRVLARLGSMQYRFVQKERLNEKTVTWFLLEAPGDATAEANRDEGFVRHAWMLYDEARRKLTYQIMKEFLDKAAKMTG
jgi:8-oxo-dGTP pyrophosphatase MutT (NUDIX family)